MSTGAALDPPEVGRGRAAALSALVAAAVALFVTTGAEADVLGAVSVMAAASLVGWLAWRTPAVCAPLLLAFFLRALASVVQAYLMPLPGSGLDAVNFELIGWSYAGGSWGDLAANFRSGALLYSWLIGLLYWLFGRSVLMVQVVNALLGTLVVYNVFLIARLLWGDAAARRGAFVAAMFPTLVLFSAITLREQMVGYPLTLGALWIARWRETDRIGWLAGAMVAFVAAIAFHTVVIGAIAYAAVAVVGRALQALRRGEVGGSLKAVIGLGVVVAMVAGVFLSGWGGGNVLWWFAVLNNLDSAVGGQQMGGQVDRTDYLTWMVTRSPLDVAWQLPIRAVFFFFMPFPWLVRAVVDLVGLVDAALYAWLFWSLRSIFPAVWRRPAGRSVFLLMMSVALVFSLVISNYGTAIRQRGKVAPLLVALAAGSLVRRKTEEGARG
ncbi:MAG: glycosyltransferase family 39 protein, partial [Gemmatimonadetes bacterium]|nr:glycosyltransferase family 39 protein [Gemmatimonadota bacterium]